MVSLAQSTRSRLALALIWLCWTVLHPAAMAMSHAQNVRWVEVCSATTGDLRFVLQVVDLGKHQHDHGTSEDCPLCIALPNTHWFEPPSQQAPRTVLERSRDLDIATPDWAQPPTRAPPQAVVSL